VIVAKCAFGSYNWVNISFAFAMFATGHFARENIVAESVKFFSIYIKPKAASRKHVESNR
jgi:hypothetical protein